MKLVLVVDDEVSLTEPLRAVLEDEGYRLVTAENGREALARLAEERPDLAMLDLMMPYVDGAELCRRMKADPELRSIPVLLMSAVLNSADNAIVPHEGFVVKPFDLLEVLDLVAAILGRD